MSQGLRLPYERTIDTVSNQPFLPSLLVRRRLVGESEGQEDLGGSGPLLLVPGLLPGLVVVVVGGGQVEVGAGVERRGRGHGDGGDAVHRVLRVDQRTLLRLIGRGREGGGVKRGSRE